MLTFTCKKSARYLDATLQPSSSRIRHTASRTDHDRPQMARPYSTPSKRAQTPAMATQTTPVQDLPPPFVPAGPSQQEPFPLTGRHLNSFLKLKTPLTIIPMPLPTDKSSSINDFYYPDSQTQDLVAVIDTCLNECYDVPRARTVFEALRLNNKGEYLLKVPVFNKFLQAYATMATQHEQHRDEWVREAWVLFNRMEAGEEKAIPNAETYTTMLLLWKRSALPSPFRFLYHRSHERSVDTTRPRIR
jgi:DNA-directed RNA polymerase